MARMPRVVVLVHPYHVAQCGNRRQKTFFCASDYHYYLELISRCATLAETDVWAYCLMPNHVHLEMLSSTEDRSRATLSEAQGLYTRHINFRE